MLLLKSSLVLLVAAPAVAGAFFSQEEGLRTTMAHKQVVMEFAARAQEGRRLQEDAPPSPAVVMAMLTPCLNNFDGATAYVDCLLANPEFLDADGNVREDSQAQSENLMTNVASAMSDEELCDDDAEGNAQAARECCDGVFGADDGVGEFMLCFQHYDATGFMQLLSMDDTNPPAGCEMLMNRRRGRALDDGMAESLASMQDIETGMDQAFDECSAVDYQFAPAPSAGTLATAESRASGVAPSAIMMTSVAFAAYAYTAQ